MFQCAERSNPLQSIPFQALKATNIEWKRHEKEEGTHNHIQTKSIVSMSKSRFFFWKKKRFSSSQMMFSYAFDRMFTIPKISLTQRHNLTEWISFYSSSSPNYIAYGPVFEENSHQREKQIIYIYVQQTVCMRQRVPHYIPIRYKLARVWLRYDKDRCYLQNIYVRTRKHSVPL